MNRTIELSFRGIPLRYTNPEFAASNDYVGRANVETLLDLVGSANVLNYDELAELNAFGTDTFKELSEFMYTRGSFPLILERIYLGYGEVKELYLLDMESYEKLRKVYSIAIPENSRQKFFLLLEKPNYPIIDENAYNGLIYEESLEYIEDILTDEIIGIIEDDVVQDWAYDNKGTVAEILNELCSDFGEYPEEVPSGGQMYFRTSKAYEKRAIKEITDAYREDTKTTS